MLDIRLVMTIYRNFMTIYRNVIECFEFNSKIFNILMMQHPI